MIDTLILMSTLTALFLAVGFVVGGTTGVIFAFAIALVMNFLSYWFSDKIVLRMYGATPYENQKVHETVGRLAHEYHLPRPKIFLVKTRVPNAFATGRDPRHSSIALTEGVLALEEDELEGVLAHEMGHIKNRDILVSSMAATVAGAIAYVAQMAYFSARYRGDNRNQGNGIGIILVVILAPLAAMLVRLAISRRREYKADTIGALITKKPGALASALRKIDTLAREHPLRGPSATSHLWFVNPFRQDWFSGMFMTHPPTAKRIEALQDIESELKKEAA